MFINKKQISGYMFATYFTSVDLEYVIASQAEQYNVENTWNIVNDQTAIFYLLHHTCFSYSHFFSHWTLLNRLIFRDFITTAM